MVASSITRGDSAALRQHPDVVSVPREYLYAALFALCQLRSRLTNHKTRLTTVDLEILTSARSAETNLRAAADLWGRN